MRSRPIPPTSAFAKYTYSTILYTPHHTTPTLLHPSPSHSTTQSYQLKGLIAHFLNRGAHSQYKGMCKGDQPSNAKKRHYPIMISISSTVCHFTRSQLSDLDLGSTLTCALFAVGSLRSILSTTYIIYSTGQVLTITLNTFLVYTVVTYSLLGSQALSMN